MPQPKISAMKNDLSIPEAAALCSVSRWTMKRYVNRGLIKGIRRTPSGRARIPRKSIQKYIASPT